MEECDILSAVRHNPENIRSLKNPSKKIQLACVAKDPYCIKYITNPCFQAQAFAVQKAHDVICCIHNPAESIQLLSVSTFPESIKYIHNPSNRVQLRAISKNVSVLKHISNPSIKTLELAVKIEPRLAFDLHLDNRLCQLALTYQPSLLLELSSMIKDSGLVYAKLVAQNSKWCNPYSMV